MRGLIRSWHFCTLFNSSSGEFNHRHFRHGGLEHNSSKRHLVLRRSRRARYILSKGGARETFGKPEPVPIYRVPKTRTPPADPNGPDQNAEGSTRRNQ